MNRPQTGLIVDAREIRAATREAEQTRARRMDKPATEVIRYARAEAERDCIIYLMSKRPQED